MLSRISLHLVCLARRPARAPFFLSGIGRELTVAYYLSSPLALRVAFALLG